MSVEEGRGSLCFYLFNKKVGAIVRSADEGVGGLGAVLEGGGQLARAFVVASETVDAALHEDEAVLGRGVLAVLLQMFADGHCLLNEVVEVLRQFGSHALFLENAEDLASGDLLDLGHALRVTQVHADL